MSLRTDSGEHNGIPPWRRLLIDREETAEMLGVSLPTLDSWTTLGLITPVEMPRGIRRKLFRRADIEAYVSSMALVRNA